MALEDVRRALRSDDRNVLIEAPAGCGKTFEAARLAAEASSGLPSGAEVLVLAHTNAAVQEVIRRTRGGARVRVSTLDGFCLEILSHYAPRLGLPTPLSNAVGAPNGVPFNDLAPHTYRLLARCPAITMALAHHYPLVLLDEHQDASTAQHEIVALLARTERTRVRLFADQMQAIYEDNDHPRVSWERLLNEADVTEPLTEPQRWADDRALGDWILAARHSLSRGEHIPTRDAPPSVRVIHVPGMNCVGHGHGRPVDFLRPINQLINAADAGNGTVALLSRSRNHVWGLHTAAAQRVRYNEGAEFEDAYKLLDDAQGDQGRPRRLALRLVRHLKTVSSGITTAMESSISNALLDNSIRLGRMQTLRAFVQRFQPLYESATVGTFCRVAGDILANPPPDCSVRMPMTLRVLGQLRPAAAESRECLDEAVRRMKAIARRPTRIASTIHKAKGLEFDHVLVSNFSNGHFPNEELARRLAYVAISRARRSVTFLVPGGAPSPLLG